MELLFRRLDLQFERPGANKQGRQSLRENPKLARSCSARIQAGILLLPRGPISAAERNILGGFARAEIFGPSTSTLPEVVESIPLTLEMHKECDTSNHVLNLCQQ